MFLDTIDNMADHFGKNIFIKKNINYYSVVMFCREIISSERIDKILLSSDYLYFRINVNKRNGEFFAEISKMRFKNFTLTFFDY